MISSNPPKYQIISATSRQLIISLGKSFIRLLPLNIHAMLDFPPRSLHHLNQRIKRYPRGAIPRELTHPAQPLRPEIFTQGAIGHEPQDLPRHIVGVEGIGE
jgi:hypothetical protein